MGIKKLLSGSLLVKKITSKNIPDTLNFKENLSNESWHGMIYYEEVKESTQGRIIHSQSGGRQEGVRSHLIEKAISPAEHFLGDIYVLSPKQKEFHAGFAKVASRWDPNLTWEQAKKRPTELGSVLLPTRYNKRNSEVESNNYHVTHTLYRAFRAYLRNHTPYKESNTKLKLKAQPLSKKKGISCSDFVSYSYKVTLLESIFPKKLPKKIQQKMEKIAAYKKKNHISKLEQIPNTLFQKFANKVEKYIPKEDKNYQKLCVPAKGMGIEFFTSNAFEREEDWEFSGYLCYVKRDGVKETYESYVIDHDTYKKLCANKNPENKLHSIMVSQEEIDEIKHVHQHP